MIKRIFAAMTALVMSLTLVIGISAQGAVSILTPSFSLYSTSSQKNVKNTDSTFNYQLTLMRNTAAEYDSLSISLKNTGGFSMISGLSDINNIEVNQTYSYTFSIPENTPVGKQYLVFDLTVTYKNNLGETVTDIQTLYAEINVINGAAEISKTTANLLIENVLTADGKVSADVINDSTNAATAVTVGVKNSSGEIIAKKYVTSIASGETSSFEFTIPEDAVVVGKNNTFTLFAEYKNENSVTKITNKEFTISTSKLKKPELISMSVDKSVYSNLDSEISFVIVNSNSIDLNDCVASVRVDGKEVSSVYIGTVAAHGNSEVKLTYNLEKLGKHDVQVYLEYTLGSEKGTIKSDKYTVTVEENVPLEMKLDFNKDSVTKTEEKISVSAINFGDSQYIDCIVSLIENGKEVDSCYIGTIEAHSSMSGELKIDTSEIKTRNYTVKIAYADAAGKKYSSTEKISVNILSSETATSEVGDLKLQSVKAPLKANINEYSTVTFTLTNPTKNSVTGIEASLLDSAGNVVFSIFIPEVAANSTADFNLDFASAQIGSQNFTIRVEYTDNDKVKQAMSRSFTTNFENKSDNDPTESSEPANVRIGKIDVPAKFYTGVKTEVPFSIINGGKGTAYNVEIYVTDDAGNELAREYIGNVSSAQKSESKFILKFNEVGEKTLNFNLYYENADNTSKEETKTFDINAIEYRIIIGDISNTDWLVENEATTIEFSVQNSGSIEMLNTTAKLVDQDGNEIANVFVGKVEANTKVDRQKFKNITFSSTVTAININLSYENTDGEVFYVNSDAKNVTVNTYDSVYGGMDNFEPMPDEGNDDIQYDENGNPIDPNAPQGLQVWVYFAIGGGVLIVAIIVIVVVVKRKKTKNNDDDLEYFYAQNSIEEPKKDKEIKK